MREKLSDTPVSVIVPSYNAGSTIQKCIQSILDQNATNLEVIAINDGSTDDTLEKLQKFNIEVPRSKVRGNSVRSVASPTNGSGPNPAASGGECGQRIQIIDNKVNKGVAYSRNLGVNVSTSPIVLFVDSDVVIPRSAVSRVRGHFIDKEELLGIGAVYSENTSELNFISDYKNLDLAYRCTKSDSHKKYLGSFFLALKKKTLTEVGGFSSNFVEDIELGYKITEGKKLMYMDKDIQVDHLKKYSFSAMLKVDFRRIYSMMAIISHSKGKYMAGEEAPLIYFVNLILVGLLIFSVIMGGVTQSWVAPPLLILAFTGTNYDFLAYLQKKRGFLFAIGGWLVFTFETAFIIGSMVLSFLLINSQSLYYKVKNKLLR